MKRLATVTFLLAVAAAAMLTIGAGDDGGAYKVRAIFDNAGFIITGEDVKVAGVKVGRSTRSTSRATSRRSWCSTSRTPATRTSAPTPAARSARSR